MTRVSVTVDIDLEDFDDDDLLDEIEERGLSAASVPPLTSDDRHPMHHAYYALKAGDDQRALAITRQWLCDALGVVL